MPWAQKQSRTGSNVTGKYFGMDSDAYDHAVTFECLEASGHKTSEPKPDFADPYIIAMGQLTVYRCRQ